MNKILVIFIGGGLGTLLRAGIYNFFQIKLKTLFPIATLSSNLLSCTILGVFILVNQKAEINLFKLLIITGFCGGLSTFSTFSYETAELLRTGNTAYAISNIALSLILCIGMIYLFRKL